jgi:hypothetical protein
LRSEVAELAGVSRQAVLKWAMRQNIDAVEIRRNWLAKAWREATRRSRK